MVSTLRLSAFNPVERGMAPLSHDIAGLILPHDSFGSHMDANGKTIDEDLEKRNFCKAAGILLEVWSNAVIGGHPVDCSAIPLYQNFIPPTPDPKWVSRHVLPTRHSLQIVECDDTKCCKSSNINEVIKKISSLFIFL